MVVVKLLVLMYGTCFVSNFWWAIQFWHPFLIPAVCYPFVIQYIFVHDPYAVTNITHENCLHWCRKLFGPNLHVPKFKSSQRYTRHQPNSSPGNFFNYKKRSGAELFILNKLPCRMKRESFRTLLKNCIFFCSKPNINKRGKTRIALECWQQHGHDKSKKTLQWRN